MKLDEDEAKIWAQGRSWVITVDKKKLARKGIKLGDYITYELRTIENE